MMDRLRVVVADDEGLIAMDVAEMLTESGYDVVGIGKDGVEALALGKKWQPDIFVLDLKMPRLDGIETARRLRSEGLGPVVLLTAYSEEKLVQKAGESGVYGYLLKPVREIDLRVTLQLALARYREHNELSQSRARAEEKLAARKTMDRAKGYLMSRYHLTEEQAYEKLRNFAMQKGKKIEDVAAALVQQIASSKR